MSPEQANGAAVDARSDLFSLGSVMFFMATGRAPFRGEGTMAVLHAICQQPPPSPRQLNSDIPEALDIVMRRLLQKRPDDRYQSAASVRTILADYLAHRQDPMRNPIPDALVPRSSVRNSCIAALVIVLLASVGLLFFRNSSTPDPNPVPMKGASTKRLAPYVATTHFDRELERLLMDMEEVRMQWHQEAYRLADEDDWVQRSQCLREDMTRIENEWLGQFPHTLE